MSEEELVSDESAKALRVLCIEDEPEMIDLVKLILEREGFEVFGAVGGQKGLDLLENVDPDIILLDIMMPEVDGWEVFQYIKATESLTDKPVIVVTAKAQSIDKVLGLYIAKVDDYVTKPFGPQDLIASVNRVLAKRGLGGS
jgi:two-component system, OmpR family, response regulator VicR